MRLRKRSTALACVPVALLAIAVGAAAKPAPAAAMKKPKAMCQLGQNTQKAPCAPNPLFSKDVCNDYLSQVRALAAAGTRITTAGNRYGPHFNTVGCYYTANGTPQRFFFNVSGSKKRSDARKAFEQDYQQWAMMTPASSDQCDPRDPEPTVPGTVKTTIEGDEAFTVDQCAPIDNNVVMPSAGRLEAVAGNAYIVVAGGGNSFGSLTSSQLISFAEELIAKYH